jgi:hypothetical protein
MAYKRKPWNIPFVMECDYRIAWLGIAPWADIIWC